MEPDGPLRQSQAPANCPYPEPDQSSPFPLSCHLWKIHCIITLSSMPRSSKCLLPIRSPHQSPVCTYPVLRTCHMPSPSHFPWFDSPNNICEQYRSLSSSLCTFLHSPVTSSFLVSKRSLNTLFSNTLSPCSSLNVSDQVLHPYKTSGKITLQYILIFIFLELLTNSSLNSRYLWCTIRQVNDIRSKCHCP